jgi:cell division transport system permease protein
MRASFVLEEVINGLRRNVTMTIAMVLTTAISVGLLGGGLLVVRLIDKMQSVYQDQVEVVVFLDPQVSASDTTCSSQPCSTLKSELQQADGVQSVTFQNRDQAFAEFNKVFQSQPELRDVARVQALPASLRVRMNDLSLFPALQQKFSNAPGVDTIVNQADYLGRLFSVLNGVRNATFSVALIQALAALLLISNTIQLSAFTRRTETGIMRLVGATRWYTQLPFLLEAMVSGLIGALLAIVGLLVSKAAFIDRVMAPMFSTGIFPQIGYGDIAAVSPVMLLVAAVISAVTGYVTLRLYVRL